MINRILVVLVLSIVVGAACSQQPTKNDYKSEATALCDAFNPSTWRVDFQKLSPVEKAKMLSKKIQDSIKSGKMKEIYLNLVKHKRDKDAYYVYVKNVSQLIGEKYQCKYIKDYLSISYE